MSAPPNRNAANATFEFAALAEARNYRSAILREFSPVLRDTVVEVGAGIGQFTELIQGAPAVRRVVAVEPDAEFARCLRATHSEWTVVHGTAADLADGLHPRAIVSVNVLEHIEHDAAELARYHRLLQPAGGALCLLVPARPEIYAPIDRDFGHYRRYTRGGLRGKLRTAGFRVERLCYFNFAGYFGWWWMFRALGRCSFDMASVRWYDRRVFPVINWFETRVCRPPIGQSLLAVARAA